MALELTQPPIINLTPNQGTATLGGPTGTNLTLGSPNPATDGGVAGFVGDALSATHAALSATYAAREDMLKLAPWHAALANRDIAPATVVCIGDSVTEHYHATTHGRTYPRRLATMLRSAYPAGVAGGVGFISPKVYAGTPAFTWPGVVSGGAGDQSAGPKRVLWGLSTSGTVTYTVTGTAIDVMVIKKAGTQTFSVSVDGGAATQYSIAGGGTGVERTEQRISLGASGVHTVVVAGVVGNVWHTGIIVYDGDETAGVRVHECGAYGSQTSDWVTGAAGTNWTQDVARLSPDLIVIALGFNDADGTPTPAECEANLNAIINALRTNAGRPVSFLLMAHFTPGGSLTANWPSYVEKMVTVAGSQANTVFLDQRNLMPANAGDVLSLYYDTLHPTDKGMAMIAQGVFNKVRARLY